MCRVPVEFEHTGMLCEPSAGTGRDHRWKVAVAGLASAASTDTTRYSAPVLKSVSGPGAVNAPTVGDVAILLNGDFFGPVTPVNDEGEIQGTAATLPSADYGRLNDTHGRTWPYFSGVNCRVVVAHVQIECKVAEGSGN